MVSETDGPSSEFGQPVVAICTWARSWGSHVVAKLSENAGRGLGSIAYGRAYLMPTPLGPARFDALKSPRFVLDAELFDEHLQDVFEAGAQPVPPEWEVDVAQPW